MERDIRIVRLGDGGRARYDTFVEGFTPQPLPLTREQVGYIFETLYDDAAPALRHVVDGEPRLHLERMILTPPQEKALRGLTLAYRFLLTRPG